MSSDPFELLGLDRETATEADVRRAYAERLKVTRPEDDRAGFMALREAFEQARERVRWAVQYADDDPYEDYEEDEDEAQAPSEPRTPAIEAAPESKDELTSAPEPTHEPEYDPPAMDAEEQAFEDRVGRAMDRLVDLLTATGCEPDLQALKALLDDNEVAGIDEYQTLQWRGRQLLCDRTGYNLEPQEIRRPMWLTLEVFDALDRFYGWTTQPTTHPYVRRLNDWLAKVRTDIAWYAAPQEARKQALLQDIKNTDKDERGSMVWLWVGLGILGSQVVRFLMNANGG